MDYNKVYTEYLVESRLVEEKVKKFSGELSRESYNDLLNGLRNLLSNIDEAMDSIENRSEHIEVFESLKKLQAQGEQLLRALKNNRLINEKIGNAMAASSESDESKSTDGGNN